ncbi:bifunctional glutamate N-acetyltransferase/amino-acid acetyltransferase ArgJ [Candidatus Thioglobus sp. NP1]|uniref:bifunctional glutamate N-acetyltransferase/amino-acid acetyltransferase ArgJ n=1 Tax=Candidatus Thioglobus sp. NP1 TaxID=2508687 RepID=UPI000DED64FD|nr:bifunctional glutamate N-acetyltransferase/amino-acid acetyltransferase ArgJ [Candidatus Thioglobus sp. NP1]AXE61873.1 bifunctional ornithine acetyltransferase/N-acetylglutamate synthase [Candidatus Thioglobus sp. NP1]
MSTNLLEVKGVEYSSVASGIKKNNTLDLSLVKLIDGSVTAAVFTQNIFCAAPIIVAKNHLNSDVLALLINSGNANAGTGQKGLENAYKTCDIVANKFGIKAEQILPFSTGIIGEALPIDPFSSNINMLIDELSASGMSQLARGILTTDLTEKSCSIKFNVNGTDVILSGVAKGSGMIRPDMATMLSFIVSDISASKKDLQDCLNISVEQSFNRITVDGDTSTNDACTLSATSQSNVHISDCKDQFQNALNQLTKKLAQMIIKDGEGATKFVEVNVAGLDSFEDCLEVAYTVAHSPLVKTALFASDANWGRILAAVGRSKGTGIAIENINIYLNNLQVISSGELSENYKDSAGNAEMQKSEIIIRIVLGDSDYSESVWTTDLSYDYVKINAEYRS